MFTVDIASIETQSSNTNYAKTAATKYNIFTTLYITFHSSVFIQIEFDGWREQNNKTYLSGNDLLSYTTVCSHATTKQWKYKAEREKTRNRTKWRVHAHTQHTDFGDVYDSAEFHAFKYFFQCRKDVEIWRIKPEKQWLGGIWDHFLQFLHLF